MKRIILLLTLCLLVGISTLPASAQTTTEILQEANTEAVQVVSSGLLDIVGKLAGVALVLVAGLAFALYRSSPPIVQSLIVENGEKTLQAFKEHSEKTINKIDDKIADVATIIFNAVMEMIEAQEQQQLDNDLDDDDIPPNPPAPTPVQ